MLRSKQLLPFAKGARAWIVAGSVKPNPLDGTGNPAGSDDGQADQGYKGTKHSPVKSPSYISRVEDSSFRRGAAAGAPASGAAKFERIHEGPNGAFIPGQSIAQRSVVNTVPTPSKDITSLPGNSKGPLLSADVGHPLVDNSESANANVLAVGPGQAVKNSKGLLVKANSSHKKSAFVTGKVGEVGLATISNIPVQGSTSKHERISKVKALDAEGNSVLPLPKAGKSDSACVENSVASDKAGPLKQSIGDNKVIESRSPLASGIPVHDSKPPPSVGCTPSVNNARKSVPSVELKQGKPVSNHTITFGTVDAPVPTLKQAKSVEAEVPLNKKGVLKSPVAAQHQVTRHAQTNLKGSSSEGTRGITNGDHVQDIVSQQGVGLSKGAALSKSAGLSKGAGLSKSASTGISGGRGKTNGYSQAGVMRQSHWSARDTGGGTGSNDMVDQVGSILRRLGWTSQTVDALANFNSRLNAFHINEVLKHQREPGLAWEFFNWAKRQSGYKHDVRTYTTMIGILGRVRNFEACDRLMQDMRRDGCKPSVVTFNRLIHSYGRANYLGEALNLFHHMQEVGCDPDRVTYCTLIDLHSKAGFHDIAMDICQKMWQAGFESDTFSYTLIIHCLGKAGNLPAAYKLFLEMIDRGCTPNLVTYNIMIDLHAKAGKHHMALKLYNDMQDAGYRPDNVTYSVIMEVLGHSGHMDEAENVFIEMEQAGWTADSTTFGSLVYMWGQTGNVKKATEWYKRMLDSGLLPNVPTCNSLLWAYMRVNDYEAAREVLESMPKWGLTPTLPTYTLLLSNCTTCENQQHVDSTLLIMSRTGHPAHSFLCRLLNEIDSRQSTTFVHQFFDSLHGEEQENKRSFADALIEFFYKLDRKDRAGNIWEVAVEKKLYPSAISQRAPNYWIVDLHVMSMGTAVVALLRTLASLREGMLTTGAVPDRIEIVTGWGKHSRVSGFSKIKNVVENILGTLDAPFYVDTSNVGCFVGSGQPLVDWLHKSEMDHMLAL